MRRIRTDPALLSIPIIAVSSYAPSDEEQKAWAAGCDDFLVKSESGVGVRVPHLEHLTLQKDLLAVPRP
jgi:CheY-like chemotaxis protein